MPMGADETGNTNCVVFDGIAFGYRRRGMARRRLMLSALTCTVNFLRLKRWMLRSPLSTNASKLLNIQQSRSQLHKSSQVKFRLLHEILKRLGRPQLTQPQLRPIT